MKPNAIFLSIALGFLTGVLILNCIAHQSRTEDQSAPVKRNEIEERVRAAFKDYFSPARAALITGIVLGDNRDFTKGFQRKLAFSGVRYLTAISGLHILILVWTMESLLGRWLSRKYLLVVISPLILGYVALTGFTIPGIRASLMGFVYGVARVVGRKHSGLNALILAAVILAILNPVDLFWDVGFELSFLASLAIIYIKPLLEKILHTQKITRLIFIKETILITLAVEIATAPILMTTFKNFSWTAVLTNILVLWLVPYILFLGIALGLSTFIFQPAAFFMSFILAPLLDYFIWAVNLGAAWAIPFNPKFSGWGIILYYALLIFLSWLGNKKIGNLAS